MTSKIFPRILVVGLLAGLWADGLSAQTRVVEAETPTVTITQQDLKSYAVAALEIQKIGMGYREQAKEVPSTEERLRLQTDALDRMAGAVKEAGLSVDKYNAITSVAETNPDVAAQIATFMESTEMSR